MIGDEGLKLIASGLQNNESIESLVIADNDITSEGVE